MLLKFYFLKLYQGDEWGSVMSVSTEHERLTVELRSSINYYVRQDKETIQSFQCCLVKRKDIVLKTSWKKTRGFWRENGMTSCMILIVPLLG